MAGVHRSSPVAIHPILVGQRRGGKTLKERTASGNVVRIKRGFAGWFGRCPSDQFADHVFHV